MYGKSYEYYTRTTMVRVWKEIHRALKVLAGRGSDRLQFQLSDLTSVLLLLALNHPRLLDVLVDEFELNSIEKNVLAVRLEKVRSYLARKGLCYAEKKE